MTVKSPTRSFSRKIEIANNLLSSSHHGRTFVDVGSGDLNSFSNSIDFLRDGWTAYLFEIDPAKAALALKNIADQNFNASFIKAAVTHENILRLMEGLNVPTGFSVLSIDIDSFDALVLRKILTKYAPLVVIIEINERIPPTVHYELQYDPAYIGKDLTLYSSASISRMCAVFEAFDYTPTHLLFNNLIAVSKDLKMTEAKSPSELWLSGFFNTNWRELMPWNKQFEYLWTLAPEQAAAVLQSKIQELGLKADIRSA
jgi:hypothetical protein